MINEFSKEVLEIMHKKFNDLLIWGPPPDTRTDEEKFKDELKYGMIELPSGRWDMVFMHPETMKAYRTDGEYNSLTYPLEELTDFKFLRWARPMDW